jgi:hypothetical protein
MTDAAEVLTGLPENPISAQRHVDHIEGRATNASPVAMRRVVIESPFAGAVAENLRYARRCVRDSLARCEAPFASHLLYPQPRILRDDLPEERQLGIEAGLAWGAVADAVAVYTDKGISPGMQLGIDRAVAAGIPVEYRSLGNG